MAKSDSFFIRATVDTNGTTYAQTAIDLGAYVDALGKSVLRIKSIAVQYGSALNIPLSNVQSSNVTAFHLATQTSAQVYDMDDKAVIATGKLLVSNSTTTPGIIDSLSESLDIAPQHFSNGYLVGVEQIYLGVDQTYDQVNRIQVMLECTVETLSQNSAMALALSQQ